MIVHPDLLVNGLIVVGESFWVFSGAAQLRRLVKTRNTKGLSAPSQTLNAAGNIGWCTYFALNHLWYPFFTNVLVISITIALLGYTLSNHKQFIRGLIAIAVIGPITSYILFHVPAQSGWLAVAYNNLAASPQLLRIVRRRKVSGLSERGLYLTVGAILFTLSYALIIHSHPLETGCSLGLMESAIIFRFYYRHRKND